MITALFAVIRCSKYNCIFHFGSRERIVLIGSSRCTQYRVVNSYKIINHWEKLLVMVRSYSRKSLVTRETYDR